MIFHVMAQHSWETFPGNHPNAPPVVDRQRWVEGNDQVKVLGAWGYQTEHTNYAIVESDDYAAIQDFFRSQLLAGMVEVRPVNDTIALRHTSGNWGK